MTYNKSLQWFLICANKYDNYYYIKTSNKIKPDKLITKGNHFSAVLSSGVRTWGFEFKEDLSSL